MKKLLAYSLAMVAIVWSLGLAVNVPKASAAYPSVAGYFVKTATNPAVYYVGSEGNRHLFVNSVTFWTWYTGSWSNIKSGDFETKTIRTISQSDFDNIPLGDNITASPNSLLKFDNSNRMFTVTTGAKLALVPDTATAQLMFGTSWSSKVITIQGSFETDYTKDGALDVTAVWKTYTNTKLGYEIKYPGSWIYNDDPLSYPIVHFCGPEYKTVKDCGFAGIHGSPVISLRNDSLDITDPNYCTDNSKSIFCLQNLTRSATNINVDGRNASVIEINDIDNGSIYALWKLNSSDQRMFELQTVGLKTSPSYRAVFNTMISTFKFN